MRYHLTMLAYDMNDEPPPFGHGAPLRRRNEVQPGFKQAKWVKGVGFLAHYAKIGGGHGGQTRTTDSSATTSASDPRRRHRASPT